MCWKYLYRRHRKTPVSIYLANILNQLNLNPVIVRKYYNNHADEYSMIKSKFNSLIIKNDRVHAIKEAKKTILKRLYSMMAYKIIK